MRILAQAMSSVCYGRFSGRRIRHFFWIGFIPASLIKSNSAGSS